LKTKRAVIFANGKMADWNAAAGLIRAGDLLIAADGGARIAGRLGFTPQVLIGDLDSLPARQVKGLEDGGTKVIRYPVEKDETDLELALDFALGEGAGEILILAAFGGRLDQTLGNLSLLNREDLRGVQVRMDDGRDELELIHSKAMIHGAAWDIISLIPLGGEAGGVTTRGLQFPLENEILYPQKTRGISNRMTGESATIGLETGALICIHTRQGK
jgi:thiamine pyrophosphokinase